MLIEIILILLAFVFLGIPVAFALGLTVVVIFMIEGISFVQLPLRTFYGTANLPLLLTRP